MGVTKTDFVRGLQCPKMLWLDSHKPEEKYIPAAVQRRLDLGNEFGDKAMAIFGDYVETTAYRPDGRMDYAAMLERTERCLLAGTPVICEAAFQIGRDGRTAVPARRQHVRQTNRVARRPLRRSLRL